MPSRSTRWSCSFEVEVDVGHAPLDAAVVDLLVLGAVEPGVGGRAEQSHDVAFVA